MSIQAEDAMAERAQKGARVSLADIEAYIADTSWFNLGHAQHAMGNLKAPYDQHPASTMTVCVVTLKNGWVVLGQSAAADVRNFNEDLGKKLSHDHALRQIWPLLGFNLRTKLHEEAETTARSTGR